MLPVLDQTLDVPKLLATQSHSESENGGANRIQMNALSTQLQFSLTPSINYSTMETCEHFSPLPSNLQCISILHPHPDPIPKSEFMLASYF